MTDGVFCGPDTECACHEMVASFSTPRQVALNPNTCKSSTWQCCNNFMRTIILDRLPPLGFRVRVSVTPRGFRGELNGIAVGFPRGFLQFSPATNFIPPFLHTHLIHSFSFHFISPCNGATGVVGQHRCYSLAFNIGASSHLIPQPGPASTRVEEKEEKKKKKEEEEEEEEEEKEVFSTAMDMRPGCAFGTRIRISQEIIETSECTAYLSTISFES